MLPIRSISSKSNSFDWWRRNHLDATLAYRRIGLVDKCICATTDGNGPIYGPAMVDPTERKCWLMTGPFAENPPSGRFDRYLTPQGAYQNPA